MKPVVEKGQHRRKGNDKNHLHSDARRVYLHADPHQLLIIVGKQAAAAQLDEEASDVQPDKDQRQLDGPDAPKLLFW